MQYRLHSPLGFRHRESAHQEKLYYNASFQFQLQKASILRRTEKVENVGVFFLRQVHSPY